MKFFRLLLSIMLAVYMTGAGRIAFAQDANSSPFSITLAPLQYANVKGNIGKFEELNWMPNGGVEGVSDISFIKDINKNISLSVQGSEFTNDNGTGNLTLKDGDIGFFQIDYNAFRKYYDGSGGTNHDWSTLPSRDQGAQVNSPDLQMDISYFKLEAGLGPISDPYLDLTYEHDSKNGDKSLEQWASVYAGTGTSTTGQRFLAPSWEAVNDTVDTITVKEKKDFAGITFKADQKVEVDYNNNVTYMQYLNDNVTNVSNQLNVVNDSLNAKLFGTGVRAEKWMFNDNTFAALGYHYNHVSDTDEMQREAYETVGGVITPVLNSTTYSSANLLSSARALEDDHILVGNFNTNLTSNLAFVADSRFEHIGSDGSSYYMGYDRTTGGPDNDTERMDNREDQEGEHMALHYTGFAHTTLYAEGNFEQERNEFNYTYLDTDTPSTANFDLARISSIQNEALTVGGRMVPNRFFTFTTQVKQHWNDNGYNTVSSTGSTGDILLDELKDNGIDETSTLTWRPFHWLSNSLKYQFSDTDYQPRESPQSSGSTSTNFPGLNYNITKNHMLSSTFTYDITVQPIDPLLLTLTYSHAENYVRTTQASDGTISANDYIPTFNSGDNSWMFSSSYSPLENLTWTNTVCYTLSDNYVDFTSGLPLGSNFRMLNLTTGLDWTFHKWLTVGPKYEHASYRDNSLVGAGNYSANIFMLDAKFKW